MMSARRDFMFPPVKLLAAALDVASELLKCLWAVIILQFCTCSIDGHAMIWRSSPLYSSWRKACSLWNTCWMLFCEKSHPIIECWREINTTFPSGLCPLSILFPCQQQNFASLSFSFTWHLDEQYTGSTKISLLGFNHTDKLQLKAQPPNQMETKGTSSEFKRQDCYPKLRLTDWQSTYYSNKPSLMNKCMQWFLMRREVCLHGNISRQRRRTD